MRQKALLLILLIPVAGCAASPDASEVIKGQYDFGYTVAGHSSIRPSQVFDDGINTYIQFPRKEGTPAILTNINGRQQLVLWREDGPYVIVQGVGTHLDLRQGNAEATIDYAGTARTSPLLASRGPQYGLVAPIKGDPAAATGQDAVEVSGAVPFARGKASLSDGGSAALARLYTKRSQLLGVQIIARGDDSFAEGLARKRGEAIRAWFTGREVDPSVIAVSEGEIDVSSDKNPKTDVIVSYAPIAGLPGGGRVRIAAQGNAYRVSGQYGPIGGRGYVPAPEAGPTARAETPREAGKAQSITIPPATFNQAPAAKIVPAATRVPQAEATSKLVSVASKDGESGAITVAAAETIKAVDVTATQSAPGSAAPAPPAPAAPLEPVWEIKPGALLQDQIHEWAVKAGWKDRWETDLNFRITDPMAPIKGTFEDAAARMIEIYRANLLRDRAKRNFNKPRVYPNNVVVFSEQ